MKLGLEKIDSPFTGCIMILKPFHNVFKVDFGHIHDVFKIIYHDNMMKSYYGSKTGKTFYNKIRKLKIKTSYQNREIKWPK